MSNILIFLIQIISVLIASSVHEFAHAFVADQLGDPTPDNNGRLTLNPIAHIDPLGAISLLLFRFGWSKPVPINERNFENPKLGTALVSIAGPASNILVAAMSAILIKAIPNTSAYLSYLLPFIIINCALALFNLLPIPPLDGSKVVSALLPLQLRLEWERLEGYGPIILLLLILPFSPLYQLFTTYISKGIDIIINVLFF